MSFTSLGQKQTNPWGQNFIHLCHFGQFAASYFPLNHFLTVFIKQYGDQICSCPKIGNGQTRFIIYLTFVDLESPVLRNKFQDKQTFGSGEDFKRFLPYMSMGQSWSCDLDRDLDHLYKLLFPFPRRRHIEFGFDWLRCFRRCLQIWFIIYVRGPGPEADNSPGSFFCI